MKERFLLQKSASTPYGWVLTDAENGVVCTFTEGCFKSTQRFNALEDVPTPDPVALERITREMTDWLYTNHRGTLRIRALIGDLVRAIRESKGLTQEDLADLAGMYPSSIGRVERGDYSTGVDQIGHILDCMNFNTAEAIAQLKKLCKPS